MARETGLAERIVKPLEALMAGLRRRVRTGHGLGKAFRATNGILQGCPLPVVALNLLVSLWASAVAAECPDAEPRAFADDTGARTAKGVEVMQKVADLMEEYAKLSDQELHGSKTVAFGIGQGARDAVREIRVGGH